MVAGIVAGIDAGIVAGIVASIVAGKVAVAGIVLSNVALGCYNWHRILDLGIWQLAFGNWHPTIGN